MRVSEGEKTRCDFGISNSLYPQRPAYMRVFAGISYFRGVFRGTWGEWRGIGEIRSEQVVPDENRLGWKKLT